MAKDVREKILKILKEKTVGNRNIKFPKHSIRFEEVDDRTLRMTFTHKKYIEGYHRQDKNGNFIHENYNMQEASVCFESWAVIIKTYCPNYEKIILAVNDVNGLYQSWLETTNKKGAKNGHVGRFFYRALRFTQQYDWFELESDVEAEVNVFKEEWLTNKRLCNNIPQGEPNGSKKEDTTENKIDENYFEKQLSELGILYQSILGAKDLKIDENDKIYRQFPVGLFENEVATVNTVFTGGKSAIDMWSYHEDTIYPIELKYKNEMVGMITEVFFYANFLWDLLREDGGFERKQPKNQTESKKANVRGYDCMKKGYFKEVKAIFLADSYHPLITSEVIETLNRIATKEKNVPISYVKCFYEIDEQYKIKIQR